MNCFDFHLHTNWSYDANASVEFYFKKAQKFGTKVMAITEHHTMDSLPEIQEVSKNYPEVRWIPGTELTVHTSIGAVDMVCLGMPTVFPQELEDVFVEYREWQRSFGEATSEAMSKLGYEYDAKEREKILLSYRPQKCLDVQGITHVNFLTQRDDFIKRGWCTLEKYPDFWKKVTSSVKFPHYPLAERVLPVVKKCGGLTFIAHPLNYFLKADRYRMDQLREELNFDGVECAHPMFGEELSQIYRKYALEHKLLSTAGSDCHSMPEFFHLDIAVENEFCGHSGDEKWMHEILERL